MDTPLARAIKVAGSAVALAKELGCTPQAIYQWERVPAERALDVERLTGISRHDLRPDIFGPAPADLPATQPASEAA